MNFLCGAVSEYSDHLMFFDQDDKSYRYGDVYSLSKSDFSCTKRQLVICAIENTIDSLAGYSAIMEADGVCLLVPGSIVLDKITKLIHLYMPKYIWASNVLDLSSFKVKSSVEILPGYSLYELDQYQSVINPELSLLLGTSGSTGSEKYVRLSHKNIFSNAESIAKYLRLTIEDVPITTLPPHYTYGLSIIHSHILVGSSIAVTNKTFFDTNFWSFLKRARVTNFGGVPYNYEILRKLKFNKKIYPHLRALTQAGGKMDTSVLNYFLEYCSEKNIEFYTMYGQTEATARMSYLPQKYAYEKLGSIGIAIPGGTFWLEDQNGQIINSPNKIGQLVYKGDNVSLGYAHSYKDLNLPDQNNNILYTGDLARVDDQGFYYIEGRESRFLKLFGNRINPQDIENLLLSHDFKSYCTGRDDQLDVFVIYSVNFQLETVSLIKKIISEFINTSPSCIKLYFITEFPRTDSGKIKYNDITPDLALDI